MLKTQIREKVSAQIMEFFPMINCYMYKKALISIIFLFLFGCSTMDNMVGFSVSFDKVVSKECVTTILSNMQGVSDFKEVGNGVRFISQKYKVDFDYVLKGSLVSGYDITIDGMFLGQNNATFIQNSHSLQKRLHSSIEQGCY